MERKDLPILCSSVWALTESAHLYKGATTSSKLGSISRNQSIGIFVRPFNNTQVQKKFMENTKKLYSKLSQPGYKIKMEKSNMTPSQSITHLGMMINSQTISLKVSLDKKLGKLYWKGTSNAGYFPLCLPNAEKAFGIEKQFLVKSEIMDCHGNSKQSSNSELRILETESAKMERSIVSTRDSRNGNLYRCQRHGMGNSCWIPVLFGSVASIDSISPHKRQGIISSVLRATTLQRYPSIRTEILGNYLSQITRSLRKIVISLYRDKHTSSYVLCTNVHQPGRRAIKTDCSNGMVSINKDIQKTEQNIWHIRRGSVCNKTEQEAVQILQLVPGQSICSNQRTELLLIAIEQPLLLSSVKSNNTDLTESSTENNNYNNNYANMEIFIKRKLKQYTIKAYKSELLQLVTDKERVKKEKCFIEFIKFLNESDLIKVTNNFINIKPIIDHFKILGPTNNFNTKELTAKTCWLIAVCGFLRASDIHRVDNKRTEISNNSIKSIILAPKKN
ncbi:hypothetical protein BB561_006203, partial [Smittium simulii]